MVFTGILIGIMDPNLSYGQTFGLSIGRHPGPGPDRVGRSVGSRAGNLGALRSRVLQVWWGNEGTAAVTPNSSGRGCGTGRPRQRASPRPGQSPQVGDRPGDLQDPVVGAGGEAHPSHRHLERPLAGFVERT